MTNGCRCCYCCCWNEEGCEKACGERGGLDATMLDPKCIPCFSITNLVLSLVNSLANIIGLIMWIYVSQEDSAVLSKIFEPLYDF